MERATRSSGLGSSETSAATPEVAIGGSPTSFSSSPIRSGFGYKKRGRRVYRIDRSPIVGIVWKKVITYNYCVTACSRVGLTWMGVGVVKVINF